MRPEKVWCLPTIKRSYNKKPPSDEGGGFAARRRRWERGKVKSLPQSFALQKPAPSSEGAFLYITRQAAFNAVSYWLSLTSIKRHGGISAR